ncbi:hypothetical protein BKA62DRAFT_692052 [Auriculariales sp. MPI-PUGE-AT-0066]|nr:hypothetical protein BKA62DRAFT_692052 [Auriculariales sp. MPI-PUGE-AT-0066]
MSRRYSRPSPQLSQLFVHISPAPTMAAWGHLTAPLFPLEIWLHVIAQLRKPEFWFRSDSCCGGTWSPAPGSSIGIVQQSVTPDRGLVPLSMACRFFHELMHDELQYTALHLTLKDGALVCHNGGWYPDSMRGEVKHTPIPYEVLGPRVRHLLITLYMDVQWGTLEEMERESKPMADAVAESIISRCTGVESLSIHLRLRSMGNSFALSQTLSRALAQLPNLSSINFSGCHLPVDLPNAIRFERVERVQTNKSISSFDPFPRLRELRNNQYWLNQDGYRFPVNILCNLEVFHHCESDNVDEMEWFVEDCEVRRLVVERITSTLTLIPGIPPISTD